jgi:hypothetical protein
VQLRDRRAQADDKGAGAPLECRPEPWQRTLFGELLLPGQRDGPTEALRPIRQEAVCRERTYFHLDRRFVPLKKNELIFDTYPDDAFIALPPSLFERLRAKLP